jgi:dihydrofolate reductase
MAIIGIVAVDRAGAIGKGGSLPWRYSADLKHFKEQTSGHAVVMGRRTWASLKRPLPNRLNIVLSRGDGGEAQESVLWLRDRQSVLSLKDYLKGDLYVIGGAQVFGLFREHIERWVVTEVPLTVEGADTFMPADFLAGFDAYDSRRLDENLTARFYRRA